MSKDSRDDIEIMIETSKNIRAAMRSMAKTIKAREGHRDEIDIKFDVLDQKIKQVVEITNSNYASISGVTSNITEARNQIAKTEEAIAKLWSKLGTVEDSVKELAKGGILLSEKLNEVPSRQVHYRIEVKQKLTSWVIVVILVALAALTYKIGNL